MLGQILEPIQISDMLAAKQRLRKEFPPRYVQSRRWIRNWEPPSI